MCREQLPVWQKFYEIHRNSNFEILAIAMDTQGPKMVRRFTEAAGVTFPAAVDRAQGLWELYGFNVVPNGFFVDEQGILRYAEVGGFEIRSPEDAKAIEDLIAAPPGLASAANGVANFSTLAESLRQAREAVEKEPRNLDLRLTLAERQVAAKKYEDAQQTFQKVLDEKPPSARALVGLAAIHIDQGEPEQAAALLKKAWAIDPQNWIIRKQIWAIEHPEEFYPAINPKWQREQMEKEKKGSKEGG
ncbi:MAG: tetratricopeptide repeat protein [Acidobacteria bacterium]|nr:tetratricopeptide repeat protein [Acidobacteriota bacterium]